VTLRISYELLQCCLNSLAIYSFCIVSASFRNGLTTCSYITITPFLLECCYTTTQLLGSKVWLVAYLVKVWFVAYAYAHPVGLHFGPYHIATTNCSYCATRDDGPATASALVGLLCADRFGAIR
jgi:hypothetical protein